MADLEDPRPSQPSIDVFVVGPFASSAPGPRMVSAEHGRSLLQITSALADAVTPDEVHAAIVDHVATALEASTCGLWLRDAHVLRLARHVGYSSDTRARLVEIAIDTEPSMPVLDAYRRREPVWIPSQRALLDSYPQLVPTVTHGRSYRVSCLPLVSEGIALGALGITLDEERESSEHERNFLLLVARYAAQALERLRVLESEQRSRRRADAIARRMTILGHASRAFSEAHLEHEQRLQSIVREVGTLMDASTAITLVLDDERLHRVATYHPVPDAEMLARKLARESPLARGEGVNGQVLETGRSSLLAELDPRTVAEQAPPAYRAYFERFPAYAAMVAPLRVAGTNIGTISATRVREGQRFDTEDLELLEGLADRAASAIQNSRLQMEADDGRWRAEQLYRFANAAVSAENLDQVFEAALTAIVEALRSDRAAILLFDERSVMRFRASRRLSDRYRAAVEGHSPTASPTLHGRATRTCSAAKASARSGSSRSSTAGGCSASSWSITIGRTHSRRAMSRSRARSRTISRR
jgi:GAF domain-containing protein